MELKTEGLSYFKIAEKLGCKREQPSANNWKKRGLRIAWKSVEEMRKESDEKMGKWVVYSKQSTLHKQGKR